ncbi:hypothetical protein ECE50_002375 [Chitinophaga sp. Mgbs1]|uniref:Thioesterase domain-containing protein n=1 Tax=Chitinophaga solisilvae TaxID=1233460 RepID=A0A433WJD6_9BACT|nr:hypothetical protein [Chitinophaga solisilvae]
MFITWVTCWVNLGQVSVIILPHISGMTDSSMTLAKQHYADLYRLNNITAGQPVFWFHSITGSVGPYLKFFQSTERPVWGIQPGNRMISDENAPVGIHDIAASYMKAIRAIQPKGPYDLGGFSLGGVIAYEITRLFQYAGERVDSIVMIDSPTSLARFHNSYKGWIFNTVNSILLLSFHSSRYENEFNDSFIDRNEVDIETDDDFFIDQVLSLAKMKGLKYDMAFLKKLVLGKVQMISNYAIEQYESLPLPDPHSTTCYFFNNKNNTFYGNMVKAFCLEPGFEVEDDSYWHDWKGLIHDFYPITVKAPNHILMMHDQTIAGIIAEFCELLYSSWGMSVNTFREFRSKVRLLYGT